MNPPADLETPALLLDEARLVRNVARMQARADALGVALRPHLKTSKCAEVARRQVAAGARGFTVSTLKEAERCFDDGLADDVLYAVAIAPNKFDHARRLARGAPGRRLTLLVESADAAARLAEHGRASGHVHDAMIEVDTDGHRSGLRPDDPALLVTAAALTLDARGFGARLAGVMTHAGSSYALADPDALAAKAEAERAGCVEAAARLRAAGHRCDAVSVGSTPTALSARALDGVTEVRAGVYVFFDLVMAGVGVCGLDDIAISVAAAVIGHRPDLGRVIVDAGWMAVSRDRGTAGQPRDFGYGLVGDAAGRPIDDLAFEMANQEHGVLRWTGAPGVDLAARWPIGTLLRILPNHACATAAQHERYVVLREDGTTAEWPRFNGW